MNNKSWTKEISLQNIMILHCSPWNTKTYILPTLTCKLSDRSCLREHSQRAKEWNIVVSRVIYIGFSIPPTGAGLKIGIFNLAITKFHNSNNVSTWEAAETLLTLSDSSLVMHSFKPRITSGSYKLDHEKWELGATSHHIKMKHSLEKEKGKRKR